MLYKHWMECHEAIKKLVYRKYVTYAKMLILSVKGENRENK